MTAALSDLRALCPTCQRAVEVRRQGAAWRVVAHTRRAARWNGRGVDVRCRVQGVDALPLIRAWLRDREDDARNLDARAKQHAEDARREAAEADRKARAASALRLETAALTALLDGAAR